MNDAAILSLINRDSVNAFFQAMQNGQINVLRRFRDGNTILHVLNFPTAANNQRISTIILQRAPALLNARNLQGQTPLMTWMENHNELEPLLRHQGIDLNVVDRDGNNLYHYMTRVSDFSFIARTRRFTANINQTNNEGRTPLMNMIDEFIYLQQEPRTMLNGLALHSIVTLIERIVAYTDIDMNVQLRGHTAYQLFVNIVRNEGIDTNDEYYLQLLRVLQGAMMNQLERDRRRGTRRTVADPKFTAFREQFEKILEVADEEAARGIDDLIIKQNIDNKLVWLLNSLIKTYGSLPDSILRFLASDREIFENVLNRIRGSLKEEYQQNLIEMGLYGKLTTPRGCNICWDDDEPADMATTCGHPFHRECLNEYKKSGLSNAKKGVCPTCREPNSFREPESGFGLFL